MGKGSRACDRPGATLEASDSTKTELNLNEGAASVSEINTTLKLQQIGQRWFTKDEAVLFRKRKEGWLVYAYSDHSCKAFEEYGITSANSYEHTHFPSLKAARQAVTDVSLEAGLNIDSRLTRQRHIAYEIGDLPLIIMRQKGHWQVYELSSALRQSLKKYFNSAQEFRAAWESTDSAFAPHPTRKAAHQAVINWLYQIITEEK